LCAFLYQRYLLAMQLVYISFRCIGLVSSEYGIVLLEMWYESWHCTEVVSYRDFNREENTDNMLICFRPLQCKLYTTDCVVSSPNALNCPIVFGVISCLFSANISDILLFQSFDTVG